MNVTRLPIEGLALIELAVHGDARGFFTERFKRSVFSAHGLPTDFPQINHSRSAPGVLRGLHYQYAPQQGKLVGVAHGRIWDVAVDIRPYSETYGESYTVELSDMNGRLLWVPPGFAHGFYVLGEAPADVLYTVSAEYNPATEGGIIWSDPELAVPWPCSNPKVSERDGGLPSFADYRANPVGWR